jgi:hypothetical protein
MEPWNQIYQQFETTGCHCEAQLLEIPEFMS